MSSQGSVNGNGNPPSQVETEVAPQQSQSSEVMKPSGNMQKLIDGFKKQKKTDDPTSSPISEHLVPVLKAWWWSPFERDEIKATLERCCRPENVDPLRKVFINEEVFKKIGAEGRKADETLRYINNSFTKGCQPLVSAWDEIICADMMIKDYHEDDDGRSLLGLPDGSVLDLTAARELLDLSLQVFGMTNIQLVTSRRLAFLNKDYHELCDKKHILDYQMFGPNLKGQIEELNKFHKLGNQVTAKSSSLSQNKKKSPAAQAYWENRTRFLRRNRGYTN